MNTMTCSVCNKEVSEYKCPVCLISYCSVECCKKHKEEPCSPPATDNEDETINKAIKEIMEYEYPTEDTLPLDILMLLGSSEVIREYLKNPHLCKLLTDLDNCDEPGLLMEKYMQEPIFMEFVEECLKIVLHDPSNNDHA